MMYFTFFSVNFTIFGLFFYFFFKSLNFHIYRSNSKRRRAVIFENVQSLVLYELNLHSLPDVYNVQCFYYQKLGVQHFLC